MEQYTLVRWTRNGRPPTRIHIALSSLNNTRGMTGCGKRYPLNRATHSIGTIGVVSCGNCQKALASGKVDEAVRRAGRDEVGNTRGQDWSLPADLLG